MPASQLSVGSLTPLLQLPPVQLLPLLILLTSLPLQGLVPKYSHINVLLASLLISILNQGAWPAKVGTRSC